MSHSHHFLRLIVIAAFLVTATLLVMVAPGVGHAQGYRGTDFWICFPQNARLENNHVLQQRIYIASESRTRGQIDDLATGTTRAISVEAGASTFLDIDTTAQILRDDKVLKQCFHITTDHDISLYVISHREASSDSYAAIPTPFLGTDYIVSSAASSEAEPEFQSQCDFIATEDNTIVTIKLTSATSDSMPAGRTLTVPMNRGEVFQIQGIEQRTGGDLTGSIVHSTKPIAFFTGHHCAEMPASTLYCNMLVEMEPPSTNFGTEFVLARWANKPFYVARVVAMADSTSVTLNGKQIGTLAAGGFLEIDTLTNDALIRTTRPALVTQFITSSEADSMHIGDPSMTIVTPSNHFVKQYTSVTMVDGHWNHFLNIIVPDTGLSSLRMDGLKRVLDLPEASGEGRSNLSGPQVTGTVFESDNRSGIHYFPVRKIPNTTYVAITFEVSSGRHLLTCDVPFALYAYGFGADLFDSYSHSCGETLN